MTASNTVFAASLFDAQQGKLLCGEKVGNLLVVSVSSSVATHWIVWIYPRAAGLLEAKKYSRGFLLNTNHSVKS